MIHSCNLSLLFLVTHFLDVVLSCHMVLSKPEILSFNLDRYCRAALSDTMAHSGMMVLFVDLVLSIDMKLSDVLNHFFDLKLLSLLVHSIRLVLSDIMVHSLMVILSLDGVHS